MVDERVSNGIDVPDRSTHLALAVRSCQPTRQARPTVQTQHLLLWRTRHRDRRRRCRNPYCLGEFGEGRARLAVRARRGVLAPTGCELVPEHS